MREFIFLTNTLQQELAFFSFAVLQPQLKLQPILGFYWSHKSSSKLLIYIYQQSYWPQDTFLPGIHPVEFVLSKFCLNMDDIKN